MRYINLRITYLLYLLSSFVNTVTCWRWNYESGK